MVGLSPDVLIAFSDYAFMRKALAASILMSLSSAPLGVFLVLRRMSLMGDAIAHAILPGIAIGFMTCGLSLGAMSLGGFVAGLVVVSAVALVSRWTAVKEDAGLAAFYLMAMALGVMLISIHGSPLDLIHLLFGSVLAVDNQSLKMVAAISMLSLTVMAIIYRPLVIEAFDPGFMRAMRGRGGMVQGIFLILVVLNLVAGFQAMGTMMSVGLMMIPAVAARFWTRSLPVMCLIAQGLAISASLGGLMLSYMYNAPSGAAIILVAGALYILSMVFGRYDSIRARYFPFRHLEH